MEERFMRIGLTGSTGRLGSTIKGMVPTDVIVPLQFRLGNKSYNDIVEELNEVQPSIVLNCAAFTNVCEAEENPSDCWETNVRGLSKLLDACSFLNIPLYHISSDHVFDGKRGMYTESDIVKPKGVYAKSKAKGEEILMTHPDKPRYAILRTSFIKNFDLPAAFTDKYFSGDTVDIIAEEVLAFCVVNDMFQWNRIVNIGTGRKSIFDIAKKINPQVKPMSLEDNPVNKVGLPYLVDTSLDSSLWNIMKGLWDQNVWKIYYEGPEQQENIS